MKKYIFLLTIFAFFAMSVFAQNSADQKKLMFDETSPLLLQDIPIKEGVDEFQKRIDKVRASGREPLGLVLCGGSARAYAHVGALKAMEENGITPDFIVANSMGAIIGMLYAYGFSPDKIGEMITSLELTSYFEPTIPIHGGVLSVRDFRTFLNDLVGNHMEGKEKQIGFDIKDSTIPIIVLSDDLYSKRQIWHASGDFARIMTAAFSMPVYMEPVKYKLSDGTPVYLTDSGTLDIGGLKVAESFSSNLIVSTAFYDTKLDYNNVLVCLNRTMTIGKERIIVSDLKRLKPAIIRNDVEHYSFMAFDKASEFFKIGYESAMKVMDSLKKLPHGYNAYAERRKITDSYADTTIRKVKADGYMKQNENYFGMKIWPQFSNVDYPDYNLYKNDSIAAFMFEDTSVFYGKLGMNFPFTFTDFVVDAFLEYRPLSQFSISALAAYSFLYDKGKPEEFFLGSEIKIRPDAFPTWVKPIFLTGEFSWKGDFSKLNNSFFQAGMGLKFGSDLDYLVSIKPYYYMSGSEFASLSNGAGLSLESSLNFGNFKKMPRFTAGISTNASGRYSFFSLDKNSSPLTEIYHTDFYRGKNDIEENQYIITDSSELYFVCLDPRFTFAEVFILKQYKIGAFYDFVLSQNYYHVVGGFLRAQISLVGLSDFVLEAGYGWNLNENDGFLVLSMKNRI
ncbi:MAG: patatin-like phospholipase family protein [Treponemataceae bacterium]|nr:patatin-like phospholipase family protein [Treponemataceae bacterium]